MKIKSSIRQIAIKMNHDQDMQALMARVSKQKNIIDSIIAFLAVCSIILSIADVRRF